MRNAQFPFSQTRMALLEKEASLAEKYKFRGICFILSLRWLELKGLQKSDSDCITGLKEKGRFLSLWKDFELQSTTAQNLKETIELEIENASGQIAAYDIAISGTKHAINQLTTQETEQHIQQLAVLQTYRTKKKELVNLEKGGKAQLQRMFASEQEQASGEPGTASEQLLRRMFAMSVKMVSVAELTVKSKSAIWGETLSWTEAGEAVAGFVSALAKGSAALFEIGFYGSGGHSVAVYADGKGAYSFFDPNFGVFVGDGASNKLELDVANLLKDKYPRMNKVVVSWIEIHAP